MTNDEIVQSYKSAIDPQDQITILSQLTLKSETEIIEILNHNGIDTSNIKVSKRKRYNECDWKGADGNRAKKLKSLGYTHSEIAEAMNVPYSYIPKFFHMYCKNKIYKKWTKEKVEKLMELRAEGLSFREIAAIIGEGETTNSVGVQWHYYNKKRN